MNTLPRSWAEANELWTNTRKRKLANNTYLEREGFPEPFADPRRKGDCR